MTGFSGTVTRVHEGEGSSRIEPPLDHEWSPIERLRWKAAIVTLDSKLDIVIRPGHYVVDGVPVEAMYSVQVKLMRGYTSVITMSYDNAWAYLQGIDAGATAYVCERKPWGSW